MGKQYKGFKGSGMSDKVSCGATSREVRELCKIYLAQKLAEGTLAVERQIQKDEEERRKCSDTSLT